MCNVTIDAQMISVKSVDVALTDLSAKTTPKSDLNGNPYALVKVALPLANANFEGNIVGNCEFKTNECWIYMSSGTKKLVIKYPGVESLSVNFKEYGIDWLNEKVTYIVSISYISSNDRLSTTDYENGMKEGERC